MARVPDEVRGQIARRIYEEAARLDWPTMAQEEKGRLYDRWANDPEIGGQLAGYVRSDRIRLWLKDGPLKAYTQATAGVGPYAKYAPQVGTSPASAVLAALGPGWTPDEDTVDVKPLRAVAVRGADGSRHRIVYGPARNFKDLLWAALVESDEDGLPVTILVLENAGSVPTVEREQQKSLATRCDVNVTWGTTG